jgi:tRNA A37 threonylcarbamoyladenosine dehydratase
LHALQGLVGHKKAKVMAERLRKINPQAQVEEVPLFYNEENSEAILSRGPDYIIDAIDNMTAKTHLIATARARGLKLVTASGAAARLDPQMVKITDLAQTHTDPLAHQLRKILRQKYDFPKDGPWGVPCVFSDETPMMPVELHYDQGQGFQCVCPQGQNDFHSCDKRSTIYGTASFVTGAFGLSMASWVVRDLLQPIPASAQPAVKEN